MEQTENVHEAFSPSAPIDSLDQFMGREDVIYAACEALNHKSAVPVIVGPPGIGKTSVLNLLGQVIWGDEAAIARFGVAGVMPAIGGSAVCRLEGTARWDSFDDLCRDAVATLPGLPWDGKKSFRLRKVVTKAGAGLLAAEAEFEKDNDAPATSPTALSHLVAVAQRLQQEYGTGLVIMIDEVELVAAPEEMCLAICRAANKAPALKFILGVRDYSLRTILGRDHAGFRQLRKVSVGPLPGDLIEAILDNGLTFAAELGLAVRLSGPARRYFRQSSLGEPWYAQMVGSHLLADALRRASQADVTLAPYQVVDAKRIEREAVESRLASYQALYYRITARAPKRAAVLQALAKFPESVIPSSYLTIMQARLGRIDRAITWLVDRQGDPILTRVDDDLMFVSQQFRLYCRLARQEHDQEDTLVELDVQAWRERFG